jgi:TatA/E family protein of Tat protein translocase
LKNRGGLTMLDWQDVIVIGAVALILFGPKRLPEMAKSLGQGVKEFKKATQEDLHNYAFSENGHKKPLTCPTCQYVPQDTEARFCPRCSSPLAPGTIPSGGSPS